MNFKIDLKKMREVRKHIRDKEALLIDYWPDSETHKYRP